MVVLSSSPSLPVIVPVIFPIIVPVIPHIVHENTSCLQGIVQDGSNEISPPNPKFLSINDNESIVQQGNNMQKDFSSDDVGYEVKELRGKGCGLLATKMFYPGDLIMREKPIIDMPDKVFSWDDHDNIENWLDRKINRLSCEDRAKFYNLSDARTSDFDEVSKDSTKTTLGIFFTNCMSFNNDSAGLFPTMARSNHSCTPNSEFINRPLLEVQDLVAKRSIEKGEEITLSYVPAADEGSDERKVRMNYLVEWYGFICNCQACSLKGESLRLDDALRQRIKHLQSQRINGLNLLEMDELVDGLRIIDCKFLYQKEVLEAASQLALDKHDKSLSAKFFVALLILETMIENEEYNEEVKTDSKMLTNGLKLQMVDVGQSQVLFHVAFD